MKTAIKIIAVLIGAVILIAGGIYLDIQSACVVVYGVDYAE